MSEDRGTVVYPRDHSVWCDIENHKLDESDREDYGLGSSGCTRHIAAEFVPQVNRCVSSSYVPFTRPDQEPWSVSLSQEHRAKAAGGNWTDDPVVVVGVGSGNDEVWRLLPGEAMQLAAALNRAADVLLGFTAAHVEMRGPVR